MQGTAQGTYWHLKRYLSQYGTGTWFIITSISLIITDNFWKITTARTILSYILP